MAEKAWLIDDLLFGFGEIFLAVHRGEGTCSPEWARYLQLVSSGSQSQHVF